MKIFTAMSPLVAAACIALTALAPTTEAHSWLTKPVSRETSAQVDMDGTIGCPNAGPGQMTSFQAGETIDVSYWRNNHIGGFIRWAIVAAGDESNTNFDNNVFFYTCRESGDKCVPRVPNDGKGSPEDNGRYAWDMTDAHQVPCGDTITLPDWLPAGDYVLQWTWFGAGSSFDEFGTAEAQYRSCADLKLTTSGSGQKPSCPTFVGGDRVTKNENREANQCFYFKPNNKIVKGQFVGDSNNFQQYYGFAAPEAVETCNANNNNNNNNAGETGGDAETPAEPEPETPATTEPSSMTPTPTSKDANATEPGTVRPHGRWGRHHRYSN